MSLSLCNIVTPPPHHLYDSRCMPELGGMDVGGGGGFCLRRFAPSVVCCARGAVCSNSRPQPPPPLLLRPPKVFEPVFIQIEILLESVGTEGAEFFFLVC